MSSCCYPDDYQRVFTSVEARRSARRYLKKGLTGTARELAEAVAQRGVEGARVLELGGGVGAIAADLLRRGAAAATVVELSSSWEAAAASMAEELGLASRLTRVLGDAVEVAPDLEPAEVAVAHRVLCCYPDWRGLMRVMTGEGRRLVGFTLPVDRPRSRAIGAVDNLLMRLMRRRFRSFVHPVEEVIAAGIAAGFHPVFDRSGLIWRTVVLERA